MTLPDPNESAEVTSLREQLSQALGDSYVLGQVLGSGRGGVVFQARNSVADRDVAIKVAWDENAARARVVREMSLTAEVLQFHTQAMEARELEVPRPLVAFEMPLMTGATLYELLDASGGAPIPFKRVVEIMRWVAGALDQAHSIRIVHASLCPWKILLDGFRQAFVADFGLRLPSRANTSRPVASELGVHAYTPPEQRHDEPDVDGRVDQYALAILAYELLRGRRIWHVTPDGVLEVSAIEIGVSREIAPGVPMTVNHAIKRATARLPDQRYPSIADFFRAFSGQGFDPPPPEAPVRERKGTSVGRRAVMVGSIVLVLAAAVSFRPVRDAVRGLLPSGPQEDVPTGGIGDALSAGPRDDPARSDVSRRRPGDTTGVIVVTLRNGSPAFVVIDGRTRGATPLTWSASAGRHVVVLRGEDRYVPESVSVQLAGGDTVRATFERR